MSRDSILWITIIAPVVVWFLCMETNFTLAPWTCAFGWKFVMWIVSLIGLVITAGLSLAAWAQWKAIGREWPGDAGGAVPRARYMAFMGVALSAMAFLVILAQAVPEVMLGACE